MSELIPLKSIGIIHTSFKTKDETPVHGVFDPENKGMVEIFNEYADGLKDIETFSHIYLLYYFDRAGDVKLIRPTFLDDEPHGVFATKHPCRPNGLGFTVVRLLRREKNILYIGGIDVLDKTPLLDIKPYILRFDCFPGADEGWEKGKKKRPKPNTRE
jgi:tRNA (adenine37-N6)-methyltransferase